MDGGDGLSYWASEYLAGVQCVEDVARAAEKEQNRRSAEDFDDEESVPGDDVTDFIHGDGVGQEYASESRDNLLVARVGSRGS
jgi:chitin synthase